MKKLVARILVFVMTIVIIMPAFNVFAAGDLDMDALQLFLDKLASMEESEREIGAAILQEFFANGDRGIDELKNVVDIYIKEESLVKYGYSVNDVRNELDRLKDWNDTDKAKLVEYIIGGKTSSIESLILKNEKNNSGSGGGAGTGGSSTGGSSTGGADNSKPSTPGELNENLVEINFTDIGGHWGKDSIEFLAKREIIKGKSKDLFDPEGKISRAEFTALIARLFGLEPKTDRVMGFNDVNSGAWYYKEVKSAYDNEIIKGLNESSFGPNNNITREQMVNIIIVSLEKRGLLLKLETTNKDLGQFNDKEQISSWALDSMSKAVKYGIISGRANNTLAPKDDTSRAEAATILMKLYSIINN